MSIRLPLREHMVRAFGEKFRQLRQAHHLSQAEMATRLSIQRAHVNNIESGRRLPSIHLVCTIHRVFGISADYLLRDEHPVHPAISTPSPNTREDATLGTFARHLRELRQSQGLNQTVLAERLGLRTQAHISLLEHGQKEPSIALVLRIAEVFGVSIDSLLFDQGA
ncbi:helix-turn-helix domain-containing protein [Chloroflexia bacterium SDU3-3]|nr:helix-turn-helix domain-containing protein [Chloroflexia bacterium SDU3-3]